MGITISPEYPVAGEEVTITGVASVSGTEFVFEVKTRPNLSELPLGILTVGVAVGAGVSGAALVFGLTEFSPSFNRENALANAARDGIRTGVNVGKSAVGVLGALRQNLRQANEPSDAVSPPADYGDSIVGESFVPDQPGVYTVLATEVARAGAPPSHAADKNVDRLLFCSQSTETIVVLTKMRFTVRNGSGQGAEVELRVDDTTVRQAELVDFPDEVSRVAALQSNTLTELNALVGSTVSSIGEDLLDRVQQGRTAWNAHIASAEHDVPDTENVILNGNPLTLDAAIQVLNEWSQRSIPHFQRQGGTAFHTGGDDLLNFPKAEAASDLQSAIALEADLSQMFDAHRVLGSGDTPPLHNSIGGDRANAATKAVQAAVLLNLSTNSTLTDFTSEANDATTDDVELLPSDAAADTGDAFYFGSSVPFMELELNIGQAGAGTYTLTWEYFTDTGWNSLSVVDDTADFKIAGTGVVSLGAMADAWTKTTINSQGPYYYVRAVAVAGTVTTQPLGTQIYLRRAASLLSRLVTQYLSDVANQGPSAPSGEGQGALDAAHRFGFRRVD